MEKTKVTILPTGTMHCDLTWLLLDPARMLNASRTAGPRDWVECPTHSVLIEHASGKKLLWDSGPPRDWESRWGKAGTAQAFPVDAAREDMWLDARLRQLSLEPGDFDYLLLSHLHLDHASNAQLWRDTQTQIIVDEREKKGALSFDGYSQGPYIKSDYEGLPLNTISEDTEILPGITLLRTPGHTWGTMSLQVDLVDEGTMIFTSDAIYRTESFGTPAIPAAIVYDTVAWFESVEKIRSIQQATNATVVFGHDENQIKQLRTGPGNYYS